MREKRNKSVVKSVQNTEGTRVEEGNTFNLTHLSPLKEAGRGRFIHRDFNAHLWRANFVAMMLHKHPDRERAAVLDIGCAPDWLLLTCLHSNGCAPGYFKGMDARDCLPTMPSLKSTRVEFEQGDVTVGMPTGYVIDDDDPYGCMRLWDMVVCMEVIEHMSRENGIKLLDNIEAIMQPQTTLIFSTPCFDEKVGMAESHMYEWKYLELKEELEKRFYIEDHFGTFISLKDYVKDMTPEELRLLNRLKSYYNSALVSNMMAPLYPEKSRNCLWVLKMK